MTNPPRPSTRTSVPAKRPSRRTRWESVVLGLFVAIALLKWFEPWVPRVVPEELLGVWFTSDSAYEGRALEIQPSALNFRGGGAGVQPVRRVRRDVQGARIRYQIEYEADGEPATVSFTYAPGPGVIKLDSRPTVLWHRVRR